MQRTTKPFSDNSLSPDVEAVNFALAEELKIRDRWSAALKLLPAAS